MIRNDNAATSTLKKRLALLCTTAIASTFNLLDLSEANAAIVAPAGLNPGDKFQLVFVTTATTTATTDNPAYYNNIIQTEANNAGLGTYNAAPVVWQTLGSFSHVVGPSSENLDYANDRFHPATPIYRLDGLKVANNGNFTNNTPSEADLWDDTIQNPINITSNGNTLNTFVWTGSSASGYAVKSGALPFHDTSSVGSPYDGFIEYGVSGATDYHWMSNRATIYGSGGILEGATNSLSLYAFSSELTVPVPEPVGYLLGTSAAALLLAAKRRRDRASEERTATL